MNQQLKIDYKKTFLIGFGFFASSIAWSVYNSNVPLILEEYVVKSSVIGIIMSIDNVFAVIFQPLFGALSDKTRTKRGRRLPFMLVGIPVCALLFTFIPSMTSLLPLMFVIIIFNFIMSTWRAPAVALMPDVTPAPLRSKANGVINLMGGLGAVFAFLVGGKLLEYGRAYPFLFTSVMMMLAWLLLYFFVKEPQQTAEEAVEETAAAPAEKASLNRSLLFILLAIFFWFTGYNAVETFFTLYATKVLHVSGSVATMTLTFFSLALVVGAIPAGFIGTKYGRKNTIRFGLIGMIALFGVQILVTNIMVIRICFVLAGLCWALVNINSLPMVVEIARSNSIGKYTGYYYFFASSAAILSPILFGFLNDMTTKNYNLLFLYSVVGFILAFVCINQTKHGETSYTSQEALQEAEELD